MANFNKTYSATNIRIGEVRFSYVHVFDQKRDENGEPAGYGALLLIPKTNTAAVKLINQAVEAAKQNGVQSKWNGKMPPASRLKLPLRDGDEEHPDDKEFAGMYFLNANAKNRRPGVRVLENGQLSEPMGDEDFYSGCWGAAVISFFPFSTSGNNGVAVGLDNCIKTRDDERLGGGARSADDDFSDLADGLDCLD